MFGVESRVSKARGSRCTTCSNTWPAVRPRIRFSLSFRISRARRHPSRLGLCSRARTTLGQLRGVKLLFDANLSPALISRLRNEFPGSTHVRNIGLRTAADEPRFKESQIGVSIPRGSLLSGHTLTGQVIAVDRLATLVREGPEGQAASPTVRTMTPADEVPAIATVVLAFAADPVARWSWPDSHQYLANMPSLTRAFGGRAFAHDSAHATGGYAGAALWLPPGVTADEETLGAALVPSAYRRRSRPPGQRSRGCPSHVCASEVRS